MPLRNKDIGVLATRKEGLLSFYGDRIFNPGKEDVPPLRHFEICDQKAMIFPCVTMKDGAGCISAQPVGLKPLHGQRFVRMKGRDVLDLTSHHGKLNTSTPLGGLKVKR
jgi:hypothetical protein